MKNVYMVQASNTYVGRGFRAAYLPYAVGLLVAYAFKDEKIRSEYSFKRFIFTREKTDEAVESLEAPAFVGFSNYIWNTRYNLALAEKIKKKFPECVIVFGGHNVPPDNSFLEQYPFIDFLVHGEGEEATRAVMAELLKETPDFSEIPNISYRVNETENKKNPTVILEGTDYPSPYLDGWFESIFEENPDMQLDAILETSRGCPRSCAYCDWGCNNSKIKLYPLDRILAEIDWFAEHKVKFIWGADSNFGAFERDMEIVDYLIDKRDKTGYPERLRTNYSMGNPKRVFEISSKLERFGLSKEGATLSFQSLNPTVLENIGRKNMSMEKFSELIALYRDNGITTYSELIVGLPGETYKSFCKGFGDLIAAGQHRLITVYNCELLPNSPMAQPDYMEKHGIKTAEIEALVAHSESDGEIKETTKYIVATNTMSVEDWINCNIFANFAEAFHHGGILKYIGVYLHHEKGIQYDEIYDMVLRYARKTKESVIRPAYDFFYNYFKAITQEAPIELYSNELFGELTWVPKKAAHLATIYRLDEFYWEIKDSLRYLGIEDDIINELIEFQKTVLKLPYRNNYSVEFKRDWASYFRNALAGSYTPLEDKPIRITVSNKVHQTNWKDYALEAVWFGVNGITLNPGLSCEYI